MLIVLIRLLNDLVTMKVIDNSLGRISKYFHILIIILINIFLNNLYIRFITIILLGGKKNIIFRTVTIVKVLGVSMLSKYIIQDFGELNILVTLLFILIIHPRYMDSILKFKFKDDIQIYMNVGIQKEVFLDTGNNLNYQGVPVIFTNDQNLIFKEIDIEFLVIGEVKKMTGGIRKYEFIINNKHIKKEVFIIYDEIIKYEVLAGTNLLKFI